MFWMAAVIVAVGSVALAWLLFSLYMLGCAAREWLRVKMCKHETTWRYYGTLRCADCGKEMKR